MARIILLATGNRHKIVELEDLLRDLPWEVRSPKDYPPIPEPVEDGDTFEANAITKAAYYGDALDILAVADDSGLVVDALDGAPGIRSARYAGEDSTDVKNNAKLLKALAGLPHAERTARFVCCAAFVGPGNEVQTALGMVEGHLLEKARGEAGFGYDPLFVPVGHDRTFAEMGLAEKQTMSHRARAFTKLRAYLESRP